MPKYLALPGLFPQFEKGTLEEAQTSARALCLTSENAVVAEIKFLYERSTDVSETATDPVLRNQLGEVIDGKTEVPATYEQVRTMLSDQSEDGLPGVKCVAQADGNGTGPSRPEPE